MNQNLSTMNWCPPKIQFYDIDGIIIDAVGYHVFVTEGERYQINWKKD